MSSFNVIQGNALQTLRTLDSNSFDAAFCDPPYGLEFMGAEWDRGVPGAIVWAELRRVLVPGAVLLAFGGSRTHHRLLSAIEDAGFELLDVIMWLYGQGMPKSLDISKALAAAGGDSARWKGFGTALKPAWEPIAVAVKPPAGSYVENVAAWDVAGLNIDASRVEVFDAEYARNCSGDRGHSENRTRRMEGFAQTAGSASDLGRWPANVILDPAAAAALDQQTGVLRSGANPERRNSDKFRNAYGTFVGQTECTPARGADAGGGSRFFYCAKASPSERGDNDHPTVKPLELTEYLARLILPPAGRHRRLITPFCGSGSEMVGALRAGWDETVGIEHEAKWVQIARARLARELGLDPPEPASEASGAATLFDV